MGICFFFRDLIKKIDSLNDYNYDVKKCIVRVLVIIEFDNFDVIFWVIKFVYLCSILFFNIFFGLKFNNICMICLFCVNVFILMRFIREIFD